jgi:hypothetical protein
MLRPYGMLERAFNSWIKACYEAKINPDRIMQTIGSADASAGYHAKDGSFMTSKGAKRNYCAATDTRSKDLSTAECKRLLKALKKNGFAPFWRRTGSFKNNQHFHIVYIACYMKPQLRGQVLDFFEGLNGLKGHDPDPDWGLKSMKHTKEELEHMKANFYASNPKWSLSGEFSAEPEDEEDCGCHVCDDARVPDDTDVD